MRSHHNRQAFPCYSPGATLPSDEGRLRIGALRTISFHALSRCARQNLPRRDSHYSAQMVEALLKLNMTRACELEITKSGRSGRTKAGALASKLDESLTSSTLSSATSNAPNPRFFAPPWFAPTSTTVLPYTFQSKLVRFGTASNLGAKRDKIISHP
jgi:hypothetical protein